MKVSNRIVLPVPKASHKRVAVLWKCPDDALHDVGLNVAGLLQHFLLHGMEKLLGLHQQWAFYLDILADILLRKVVHGKGAHGKPNNLIAVVMDAINEVVVAMVEIIIAHIIIV